MSVFPNLYHTTSLVRRVLEMRILVFLIFTYAALAASGQSPQTRETFETAIIASQNGDRVKALAGFKVTLGRAEAERAKKAFLAKVHYNLGVSLYHLGNYSEAAASYEKAIRLANSKYERASYALGMARAELGEWDAAEKAFLQTIAINERNGETWFDLAFVYLAMDDRSRARTAFANAIRYGTVDSAVSHNNLGVLLAEKRDLVSAEQHFRKAISDSAGSLKEAVANLETCRRWAAEADKLTAAVSFELTRAGNDKREIE